MFNNFVFFSLPYILYTIYALHICRYDSTYMQTGRAPPFLTQLEHKIYDLPFRFARFIFCPQQTRFQPFHLWTLSACVASFFFFCPFQLSF